VACNHIVACLSAEGHCGAIGTVANGKTTRSRAKHLRGRPANDDHPTAANLGAKASDATEPLLVPSA